MSPSMMEKSYRNWEIDNLEVKANQLEYKVRNQLGDKAFKMLLIKTDLEVFGQVTDNTRRIVGIV